MEPENFLEYVRLLAKIRQEMWINLLGTYFLTDTDSDPFLNRNLPVLCRMLFDETGKSFYLLTSGLPFNDSFRDSALAIIRTQYLVQRVSITISHFSRLAESDTERYVETLAKVVAIFSPLLEHRKLILSPQYNEENKDGLHSINRTLETFRRIVKIAGLSERELCGIVFPRPVIGLGRASSTLHVKRQAKYRIEAESPAPVLSTRELERRYSGMITSDGCLLVCRSSRGSLNALNWRPAKDVFRRCSVLAETRA